jgi:uncharacterized iron-regulated membrane protein
MTMERCLMSEDQGLEMAVPGPTSRSDLYRAVWRWHFYAGLLVLPFMITLSVTGAIYLFRDEIEAVVHSNLKTVPAPSRGVFLKPSILTAAAVDYRPGRVVKYTDPASQTASAEITVTALDGRAMAVYVNPYTASVLGELPDRGTIMWTVRYLHSLKFFGFVGRALVEIAAGWSILLVGTGLYLWWPRGRSSGIVSVKGPMRRRGFWKDLHAVTGVFVGSFVVFQAFTGMPWSVVWGTQVNQWANGNNFGYPAGVRVDIPMSEEHLDHYSKTSWALRQAQIPEPAKHVGSAESIGLDKAVDILKSLRVASGFAVVLPSTAVGVYSASVYPNDATEQRVIHLDQFTGKPLIDMGYPDYGLLGRWLEWTISIHMGQQFGLVNKIALLLVCVALVVLSTTAGMMWWKRRPSGSLGVPPLPSDLRNFRGLLCLLFVGGVVFPLVGLSLVLMLALDIAFTSGFRPRARRS